MAVAHGAGVPSRQYLVPLPGGSFQLPTSPSRSRRPPHIQGLHRDSRFRWRGLGKVASSWSRDRPRIWDANGFGRGSLRAVEARPSAVTSNARGQVSFESARESGSQSRRQDFARLAPRAPLAGRRAPVERSAQPDAAAAQPDCQAFTEGPGGPNTSAGRTGRPAMAYAAGPYRLHLSVLQPPHGQEVAVPDWSAGHALGA